jgi:hypothetical protein
MKVNIHPRREWRRPGKATGTLRCILRLPAIEVDINRQFRLRPARAISELASFLRRHVPTAESAGVGGSIRIMAEIRSESLGVRWKRLAQWRPGDNLNSQLRLVNRLWAELPKEKFERDDEELELSAAVAKLRVKPR